MSLVGSSGPIHISSSNLPTTSNGHFPPPPRPTHSYPSSPSSSFSSSLRRRFIAQVKPLHSLAFPTHPIRCCFPCFMSSQASLSTSQVIEKFPHIRDYRAFRLPPGLDFKPLLKCHLAVETFYSDGKCFKVTGLQLPVMLDELFSYSGPLGALYSNQAVHSSFRRLLLKKCGLAFSKMDWQIFPKKMSGLRSIMVFGVLKDQKVGKAAIMCMTFLSTILAPRKLKNAMRMIHMLEVPVTTLWSRNLVVVIRPSLRRLDLTNHSNNWGFGLPPEEWNEKNWPL